MRTRARDGARAAIIGVANALIQRDSFEDQMSATPSTMLPLGTSVPAFRLPDLDGHHRTAEEFSTAPGLLVAFICPHCPFVRHIRGAFARLAAELQGRGLAVVAINSNDDVAFPDDGPDGMRREVAEAGYTFPYLRDASQETAKAFRAACTPDFFLFDAQRRLVYRGQFDASRPRTATPVTGDDLRVAAESVLSGQPVSTVQHASIGCNIKWKPGNEPDYSR
jgi:thiol-disulfide isomerase/thioredoxin